MIERGALTPRLHRNLTPEQRQSVELMQDAGYSAAKIIGLVEVNFSRRLTPRAIEAIASRRRARERALSR